MSNLEKHPQELVCVVDPDAGAGVEVLEPREVPLGGPRALLVRRTLPQRRRSLIGARAVAAAGAGRAGVTLVSRRVTPAAWRSSTS